MATVWKGYANATVGPVYGDVYSLNSLHIHFSGVGKDIHVVGEEDGEGVSSSRPDLANFSAILLTTITSLNF